MNSTPKSTLPKRIAQLSPFLVMEVLERAQEMEKSGIDVIHMEVGEPDFPLPAGVPEALEQAIAKEYTHYTHSLGSLELRQEIAHWHLKCYQTNIDPQCIMVTSGSSPAILMTLSVLLNPGDEVLITNPGYACYKNFILYAGGVPVEVPVHSENNFAIDIDVVKSFITPRTKALMINSPMNPCGSIISAAIMKELAKLPISIISDEIYHGLEYGSTPCASMRQFSDNCFILNGFSKLFAMTGLRLGYVIAPKPYIKSMQTLQQNLFICAPSLSQKAALYALQHCDKELALRKDIYDERRRYLLQKLPQLGFAIDYQPEGAFYIYIDASHLHSNSVELAFDILDKVHLALTPGLDFGSNGKSYLRFSYATSLENIKEGMKRLETYLENKNANLY